MFNNLKKYLHNIVSFNTEQEWKALEKCLVVKQASKGEILLREGEIADSIFFVNKGLLRLYSTFNEKVHTSKFFKEFEFAASYESVLTHQPSEHTLDALENSDIFILNYADLQHLYQHFPVYERLGRLVAEDLFIFVCNKHKHTFKTIDEQYLDFIKTWPDLAQRVPLYIIATYLGITPETLSRIRKRIARQPLDFSQEKTAAIAS